jgi:hypothetical protein
MVAAEYIDCHNLKPGDAIVTCFQEKYAGLKSLFHYIIFLGGNQAIHNMPGTGVCLIAMDDVAVQYKEVDRIERFQGSLLELQALYVRAKEVLGKPYDLLSFNCESLANYLRFGKPTSRQVISVMVMVVLLVLAFIAFALGISRATSGEPSSTRGGRGRGTRRPVNI